MIDKFTHGKIYNRMLIRRNFVQLGLELKEIDEATEVLDAYIIVTRLFFQVHKNVRLKPVLGEKHAAFIKEYVY